MKKLIIRNQRNMQKGQMYKEMIFECNKEV